MTAGWRLPSTPPTRRRVLSAPRTDDWPARPSEGPPALDWRQHSDLPGQARSLRGFRPMATETQPRLKITYATLRADNEQLHREYEAGLAEAKTRLGGHHPNFIDGKERPGSGESTVRSPIDHDIILGHFATGTRKDVRDAIDAARRAQPGWFAM